MVMAADTVLGKYFEFRGAVDSTIELYCSLCRRVIYEMHEDYVQDGLAIAKEHFKDFHEVAI